MMKGRNCDYDKRNISVVILNTNIPYRLTKSFDDHKAFQVITLPRTFVQQIPCQQQSAIKEIVIGIQSSGISSRHIFYMQMLLGCCYIYMESSQWFLRAQLLILSYILSHSSGTFPLIFLKHIHSFYPYILAHSSRTSPLSFHKHSRSFYPYILAYSQKYMSLNFCQAQTLIHSVSTRSFQQHVLPQFLKHSGSFYLYILAHFGVHATTSIIAHFCQAQWIILLVNTRPFQSHSPPHFSQAQWFILSVNTRLFLVVHAHSFFSSICIHSIRTYQIILVVHAP